MAAVTNRSRQIDEIIKCGKEPSYFLNTYAKIQHPQKGVIPFSTYPFQDDCVKAFIRHRFNIILKSRQLGLSTLTAAYAVWLCLFHKDQNVLIIATKQRVAANVIRKVKTVISNLPPWLKISQVTVNNKQEVGFKNGSSIKAIPTSEDAGRSEALSLLIIDEAAFIRNFSELWTALYPTLSTGGRAIILSTPNGVGNKYHDLYMNAEAGANEFNPIKLLWSVHPDRDQAWFDRESRQLPPREISQELLCDFLSSGDTFLSDSDIQWVGTNVRPPLRKMGPDNNVWVWRYPLTGQKFLISADVSRGDAQDFSTCHVICYDGEVAAEYRGKLRPDKFAELLIELGKMYNTALLCPENNSYGYAVCMKIQEAGYPKLYYQGDKNVYLGGYVPPQELSKAGFHTHGGSRIRILSKLEELIRNKQLKCFSSRFHDELKTFVWAGEKAEALKNKNDDLVMSMAIGSWILDAAEGYSTNSQSDMQAMLASLSTSRTTFQQPEVRGSILAGPTPDGTEVISPYVDTTPKGRHNDVAARYVRNFKWLLS